MDTANGISQPQSAADLDAPMTVEEAAEYLRVEPDTLHSWRRKQNGGPDYSLIGSDGRTVRYTLRDLMAYMASRKCSPRNKKPKKAAPQPAKG
jgi:uncharacterized protein YjcR